MSGLRDHVEDPVKFGFWVFTFAIAVQLFHQIEHLAQIYQKHVLHLDAFPGLLGRTFDFEAVHFFYNAALFLSVFAVYLVYFKNPGIWRRSGVGHLSLAFAVIFQGYHLFEHSVRAIQYLQALAGGTKINPPGVVGMVVPVIELHFWINSAVIGALVVAYFAFQPRLAAPYDDPHSVAARFETAAA